MKKLLSLILVFAMLTMLVSTAFAENHEEVITQTSDTEYSTDTETDIYDEPQPDIDGPTLPSDAEGWRVWIRDLCETILEEYKHQIQLNKESGALRDYIDAAKLAEYYLSDENIIGNMSKEEASRIYRELYEIIEKKVNFDAYTELYELCVQENNPNNYYDELLWDDFTKSLEAAKEPYEKRVGLTEEYFDLKRSFNNLIDSKKQDMYDLNKDSNINLLDVVILQKYIASLADLNASQKLASSTKEYDDADMGTVIEMQKIIASLSDVHIYEEKIHDYSGNFTDHVLKKYINNTWFSGWLYKWC